MSRNLLCLFLFLFFLSFSSSENVQASVRATFPAPPLVIEAAEYLSQISNELFWDFTGLVSLQPQKDFLDTEKGYKNVMKLVNQVLTRNATAYSSRPVLASLQVALSISQAAPKINAFTEEYLKRFESKCEVPILVAGDVVCSVKDALAKLKSEDVKVFEQDHKTRAIGPFLIYFADFFAADFGDTHQKLYALSSNYKNGDTTGFSYILRPIFKTQSTFTVQGYGVELALKNTEYKVLNEDDNSDNSDDNTLDKQRNFLEIEGFTFSKLIDRHPNHASKLRKFRDSLWKQPAEKASSWSISNMGYLIAQKAISSQTTSGNGLEDLKEMIQNIPMYASTIIRMKLDLSFKSSMQSSGLPEHNLLFLNGIEIPQTASIFEISSIMTTEARLVSRLLQLGVPEGTIEKLLVDDEIRNSKSDGKTLRLEMPKNVVYMNDMEKDYQYTQWPKRVYELLQGGHPSQIKYLGKNLYTAVLVFDPLSENGLSFYRQLRHYVRNNAPIHAGVILTCTNDCSIVDRFTELSVSKKFDYLDRLSPEAAAGDNKEPRENKFSICNVDPCLFINGKLQQGPLSNFETMLVQPILEDQAWFQQKVYLGEMTDSTDVFTWKFKQWRAAGETIKSLSIFEKPKEEKLDLSILKNSEFAQSVSTSVEVLSSVVFVLYPWSIHIALMLLNNPLVRLQIIPSSNSLKEWSIFNGINSLDSSLLSSENRHKLLVSVLSRFQECFQSKCDENVLVNGLTEDISVYPSLSNKLSILTQPVNFKYAFVIPDHSAIFCHGKKWEIFAHQASSISQTDVNELIEGENKYLSKLDKKLGKVKYSLDKSTSLMHIAALLSSRMKSATPIPKKPSVKGITLGGGLLHFYCILNPISSTGPRLAEILYQLSHFAISEQPSVKISLYINAKDVNPDDINLKRYYRYAFRSELAFDDTSARKFDYFSEFLDLPSKDDLLTMGVSTPESWLVEASVAKHDLDNIRLRTDLSVGGMFSSNGTLTAEYSLSHLLIAGSCFENSSPAAGLQMALFSNDNSNNDKQRVHDTVVMANLGYFQLQARPGIFSLKLEGKGKEMYFMNNMESKLVTNQEELLIPVFSFVSNPVEIKVVRKKGQENAKLDDDSSSESSMWSSFFGSSDKKSLETINVFSLASGHLYERFLKIMMQSVVANTKSPVKFWFVANFLSPQFKKIVPLMAVELGFKVEFVSYKWPSWLRAQSEKQRMIWGYKILFLDVLFPLNVKKIIFVDADQVVRGDLKELIDMDLKGAPYGYTPFCDSNKDTEGLRFWKQGYWKDHLRGKPYHISALYVVDLERFRKIKAGDNLRAIYDNLSADPHSLANLDQDLPNYAQHMVPIFSLPQRWLFCATWCSMDDLPNAKTIDLCNNPLTKEPKLDAAKRIISEWTTLDNNAKLVELRIENNFTKVEVQVSSDSKQSKQEL